MRRVGVQPHRRMMVTAVMFLFMCLPRPARRGCVSCLSSFFLPFFCYDKVNSRILIENRFHVSSMLSVVRHWCLGIELFWVGYELILRGGFVCVKHLCFGGGGFP